jgi:hypothetical protein
VSLIASQKMPSRPQQSVAAPRLDDLLPIVVPTEMVEQPGWPGPSLRWSDVLAVTWGHFTEPHVTTYLTKKEEEELARQRTPYPQIALENLRARSRGRVWSHVKKENGVVHFLALLHEDGLGPSRLLLCDELRQVFPEGYSFCVPERTCAVVFSRHATEPALSSVRKVISGCYHDGREPVSETVFDEEQVKVG